MVAQMVDFSNDQQWVKLKKIFFNLKKMFAQNFFHKINIFFIKKICLINFNYPKKHFSNTYFFQSLSHRVYLVKGYTYVSDSAQPNIILLLALNAKINYILKETLLIGIYLYISIDSSTGTENKK